MYRSRTTTPNGSESLPHFYPLSTTQALALRLDGMNVVDVHESDETIRHTAVRVAAQSHVTNAVGAATCTSATTNVGTKRRARCIYFNEKLSAKGVKQQVHSGLIPILYLQKRVRNQYLKSSNHFHPT